MSRAKPAQKKLKLVPSVEPSEAARRILAWFFAYPTNDFTLNELCAATHTSKTSAKLVVEELVRQDLLQRTVLGRLWRLAAKQESPRFRRMKIAWALGMVLEAGIVEFVRENYPEARAIVLFGSFRKGDDVESSDLDIAVEVSGKRALEVTAAAVLEEFGYRENVPVNLHLFSRHSVDLNVFANIANGIVLDGFLEVRP